MQLKEWLKYRSLAEQQEEETSNTRDEEQPRGKGKRGPAGRVQLETEAEPSDDESDSGSDAGDGDCGSPYDRDPALGDLLQFLLSLPYVDEAWGIQDLILVGALCESSDLIVDCFEVLLCACESRAVGRRQRDPYRYFKIQHH